MKETKDKIEEIIDKYYTLLFEAVLDEVGDDAYEILIEVKVKRDGKTIRRSWRDRERMLAEMNLLK